MQRFWYKRILTRDLGTLRAILSGDNNDNDNNNNDNDNDNNDNDNNDNNNDNNRNNDDDNSNYKDNNNCGNSGNYYNISFVPNKLWKHCQLQNVGTTSYFGSCF